MSKKRPTRPRLRVVPSPAPSPPTFEALVRQACTAWRTHAWETVEQRLEQLRGYPETTHVEAPDVQKAYFALAAWHWQAEAQALRERLAEAQEDLATTEAESVATVADALMASEKAVDGLVQQV